MGYSNNFCNWKARENHLEFLFQANNNFRFDIFYLVKYIRLLVLGRKDINLCGGKVNNIKAANTGTQMKVIDALKQY